MSYIDKDKSEIAFNEVLDLLAKEKSIELTDKEKKGYYQQFIVLVMLNGGYEEC